MAGQPSLPLFKCPSCGALYQLVKAEAGSETVDHKIACRVCGGPFAAREGQYVLKYFLLRKGGRVDARLALQGSRQAKGGLSRPRRPR
jgi:hypothetical protein